ncbi:TonB-dependent receptor [Zobellia sp.]|nr:TonB-dependent receptor [Zobellia sp.]
MKPNYLKIACFMLILCCFAFQANSQVTVSGTVMDADNNELIIGANVIVVGTTNGVITDFDGNFNLAVDEFPATIEISLLGYSKQTVIVNNSKPITVSLVGGLKLDEVVVSGSRGKPRTVLTSAVPIDNIGIAALKTTGASSVDQMISLKVPSFNSTPQTISDATAHFDPSELRNLGPSRTLVLIDGKRKNQSSQVFLNRTPGKGEVGTDLKAIPSAAIERIEVLRDGASAQYGSDAIAGVINIILKKRTDETEINLESGITQQGDGFNYNFDINHGIKIGERGYLNLTGNIFHSDKTNRAAEPGGDGFFGFLYDVGAIPIEAAGGFEATPGEVATGAQIRSGDTDWQRANPDLGMTIGLPEQNRYSLFTNFGLPYEGGEFYINGGYTFRNGTSFALYRTPWWPGISPDPAVNPLAVAGEEYQGFQPTFDSDINDITFTIGNRFYINDWDIDLSLTHGSNEVKYAIKNSINTSLGIDSPTEFNPGGYKFGNTLGNLDISKVFDDLSFSVGAEFRSENYKVTAGQEESYVGGGAQSFPGLQPSNALDESRTNLGIYTGLDYDISEKFLIGGALRYETFSKIGTGSSVDNFSWKLNARQLLGKDNSTAIRASVSTGFRAPSLHQIYLSNIQTLIVGNSIAQEGTFNNVSDITRVALGVPQLDAETAFNFTFGLTSKLSNNFTITLDYYNISVDDRVLLTNQISTGDLPEGNTVRTSLEADGVESFKFFTNAADTKTQGIDLVLDYANISVGEKGRLGFTGAFNWNETDVDTDNLTVPTVFAENNIDIFGREEINRIKTGRPQLKGSLGISFKTGDFRANLNNTYYGEVTETHPTDPNIDQTFAGKVLTDLILGYDISKSLSVKFSALNLLNVYPDELVLDSGDIETNFGGRFRYPWHVNQFGFTGANYKLGFTYSF